MLGRKEKKSVEEPVRDSKVLEIDANMQGTLSFKDPVNIAINGSFEGTLETKGTLTIGPNASVKAKISGENVIIEGELVGDVTVTGALDLGSGSRLIGDVRASQISAERGAVVQGQISMVTSEYSQSKAGKNRIQKDSQQTSDGLLSADELAEYLSVKKSMIFEWAAAGKLPATKDGDAWRFDKEKVDEWVASGMIK